MTGKCKSPSDINMNKVSHGRCNQNFPKLHQKQTANAQKQNKVGFSNHLVPIHLRLKVKAAFTEHVSAMLIVTMSCGYICHLSARWDNSMTAGYCWSRRVFLLPVFIRFYLWRPTWVLDIWNEETVCVRMSGGRPHFLDQLCEPVWGLKAERLAVMWKLRARGWMVALKGQTPSREKCCKKQTKHKGKENLTERNRSVSGGTLMWRTWQKPKDPNTLKRLKVHRYKSQWWFFLRMYLWYIHHLLCFLCFCSLLTPQDHRRIENTH